MAAQQSRLRQYCDLHDLGEPTVFSDPGYSGGNMDRPRLAELIAAVKSGDISHVIVWRLDRLSRNLKDILTLSELFQKHGVAFVSFSENFDTSTAAGRMFFNITGVFAHFYRDQLSENVKMGMLQAVKQGNWINRPPTGYTKQGGLLVANEDALRVKRAFELAAKTGISLNEVARQTGFKAGHIRQVLGNRVYLGETRLADRWYPGNHEPLIGADLFEDVQTSRKPYIRMWHNRSKHYLSGHIYCGECGRALSISYPAGGRRGATYRCHHREGSCPGVGQKSRSTIEAGLIQALEAVKTNQILTAQIRAELKKDHSQYHLEARTRLKEIQKRLSEIERKKQRLLEALYAGLDIDVLKVDGQALSEEAIALTAERENIVKMLSEKREAIEDFEDVMKTFRKTPVSAVWEAATVEERQSLICGYFEKIHIYRDRLVTKLFHMRPIAASWEDIKNGTHIDGVRGGT